MNKPIIEEIKSATKEPRKEYPSPSSSTLPVKQPIFSNNLEILSAGLKENVVYDEAILERKHASFENLKKWDNQRSHLLHLHGKFVDILLSRLDQKLEFSNNFMYKIVRFFKEKVIQESEYAAFNSTRIPNFTKLFNENITERAGLFKSFSEIDEMNQKKTQQIETYVDYIEKIILKEILKKENSEFKISVSFFKDHLFEIKKNLSRINVETAEKSSKYSKAFHEMLEPPSASKPKRNLKDLFNLELNFLKIAEEQSNMQKQLGCEAVAFWKELIKIEINRIHTIQKVMLNYLVHSENMKSSAKNKFQSLNPQSEIENIYSVNGLFIKEEILAVEKFKENQNITLEDCFDYLQTIEIQKFKEDHLILKEILLERDHGSHSKEFHSCRIIFTIDNNLLIFDETTLQEYNPANFCLRIDGIKLLPRQEDKMVEISAKVTGFLFDSRNKFVFLFENNDKVEEFVNYFNFLNSKKNNYL